MNASEIIKNIEAEQLKAEAPQFSVGDTVKVYVKIKEGDKSRIQLFEGTVIAKKHGGISETFTVRRVAHGCGIERVFPLHSPVVDRVEVVRKGKVRRAKLYYLRDRVFLLHHACLAAVKKGQYCPFFIISTLSGCIGSRGNPGGKAVCCGKCTAQAAFQGNGERYHGTAAIQHYGN